MTKAIVKSEEYISHLEEYFTDKLDELQMELNIKAIEDSKTSEFNFIINDCSGFYQKLEALADEYRCLVLQDDAEDMTFAALQSFKEESDNAPTHRERFIYDENDQKSMK